MATRTHKAKYEAQDDSLGRTRSVYCHAKHATEIYYKYEDEPEAEAATTESAPAAATPAAAARRAGRTRRRRRV